MTFISQVRVDSNDPGIKNPTKYIGKRYNIEDSQLMIDKYGWKMKEQEKGIWRRVVASPIPQYLFNGNSINIWIVEISFVRGFLNVLKPRSESATLGITIRSDRGLPWDTHSRGRACSRAFCTRWRRSSNG